MPHTLSVLWLFDEQMMTGTSLVASSRERVRVAWKPFCPGNTTSISTRSGLFCLTLTSASSALPTATTPKPFLVSMSHNSLLSVGESSTIKTFLICITASFRQFDSRGDARGTGVAVHGLDERLFGEWLGEILIRPCEFAARAVEN